MELSFFNAWEGQFDKNNLYQLTWLKHHYPQAFLPTVHPIHRNTGVLVHDVYTNKQNELLLDTLMNCDRSKEELNQMFLSAYTEPPSAIGIQYRHGKVRMGYNPA
jgi:hypothetical protein